MVKDWGCAECFLQVLKSSGLCFTKVPGGVFLAEVCEGLCGFHIMADKLLIKVGEAQKGLYFSDITGFWPCFDCCNFGWVHK